MNRKSVITFDYYMQIFIFVCIGLALFSIVFTMASLFIALIGWFFLGVWQVLMSIIQAIAFSDKDRIKHLTYSIIYIIVAIALSFFIGTGVVRGLAPIFFFIGLIVSIFMAMWCFNLNRAAKDMEQINHPNNFEHEDLLDETMIYD